MASYDIQIALDQQFTRLADEDRLAAVICRYVPDKELAPGAYWWRVALVDPQGVRGQWSPTRRFSVQPPQRDFAVKKEFTFVQIKQVLAEAAAHAPAIVNFEKGDYRLEPGGAAAFLELAHTNDLIVDGGGGTFTFTEPLKFVTLEHCQRVLLRHFNFDLDPLPYTAGRVTSLDAKAGAFEVEIAPGHPLPESNPNFKRDKKGMIVDPRYTRIKRGADLIDRKSVV